MGWFRRVCSNGLTIGVTRSESHRRHIGDLQLDDISLVLRAGMNDYKLERDGPIRWRNSEVNAAALRAWVNHDLKAAWGFKAAARAFTSPRSAATWKSSVPTRATRRPAFEWNPLRLFRGRQRSLQAYSTSAKSWRGSPRSAGHPRTDIVERTHTDPDAGAGRVSGFHHRTRCSPHMCQTTGQPASDQAIPIRNINLAELAGTGRVDPHARRDERTRADGIDCTRRIETMAVTFMKSPVRTVAVFVHARHAKIMETQSARASIRSGRSSERP
jgi:hypothetical protein